MSHPIILYDGVCNLCQSSVQFVIARDSARRFRFASLQSERGRQLLETHGLDQYADLSAVIVLQDGQAHVRSDAAIAIARQLDPPWPLFAHLALVPRRVRDAIYDFIGTRRYRWFGRKEQCWVPSSDLTDRFVD